MAQHGSKEQLPIILIRGFGGIDVADEINDPHQGFNTGTVYPRKVGENYIYEGMILRFLKSMWNYQDATNIVGFYPEGVQLETIDDGKDLTYAGDIQAQIDAGFLPWLKDRETAKEKIRSWQAKDYLTGSVRLDAKGGLDLIENPRRASSLWVYRYYDFNNRRMKYYGTQLSKLIGIICDLTGANSVNIIAHSMGGLVARALIQDPDDTFKEARGRINKLVTLGTPHKGIAFQYLPDILVDRLPEIGGELELFNPENQADETNKYSHIHFAKRFDLTRTLCIVGTNWRTYDNRIASLLNRFFAIEGDGGRLYNKSDGLVKQRYATLDGAHRADVHKCHGGSDSLVTSREAYEIANRFFFGDRLVRLYFLDGQVNKRSEWFSRLNKPEYYFGVSVKPRGVDFELFHQSEEAENCAGPFNDQNLSKLKDQSLLLETFLDTQRSFSRANEMGFQLMFYIGERDLGVLGYSDDIILHRPIYINAVRTGAKNDEFKLQYFDDTTDDNAGWQDCELLDDGRWAFPLTNPYFQGRFAIEVKEI